MDQTWAEKGKTITVTGIGKFKVDGDEKQFDSLGEARVRARELNRIEAKIGTSKAKLPALTHRGEPCDITGLHLSRGFFLTKPTTPGERLLYVRTPETQTLVERMLYHVQCAEAIKKVLFALEVHAVQWGEGYVPAWARIVKEHAAKSEAASKLSVVNVVRQLEERAFKPEPKTE